MFGLLQMLGRTSSAQDETTQAPKRDPKEPQDGSLAFLAVLSPKLVEPSSDTEQNVGETSSARPGIEELKKDLRSGTQPAQAKALALLTDPDQDAIPSGIVSKTLSTKGERINHASMTGTQVKSEPDSANLIAESGATIIEPDPAISGKEASVAGPQVVPSPGLAERSSDPTPRAKVALPTDLTPAKAQHTSIPKAPPQPNPALKEAPKSNAAWPKVEALRPAVEQPAPPAPSSTSVAETPHHPTLAAMQKKLVRAKVRTTGTPSRVRSNSDVQASPAKPTPASKPFFTDSSKRSNEAPLSPPAALVQSVPKQQESARGLSASPPDQSTRAWQAPSSEDAATTKRIPQADANPPASSQRAAEHWSVAKGAVRPKRQTKNASPRTTLPKAKSNVASAKPEQRLPHSPTACSSCHDELAPRPKPEGVMASQSAQAPTNLGAVAEPSYMNSTPAPLPRESAAPGAQPSIHPSSTNAQLPASTQQMVQTLRQALDTKVTPHDLRWKDPEFGELTLRIERKGDELEVSIQSALRQTHETLKQHHLFLAEELALDPEQLRFDASESSGEREGEREGEGPSSFTQQETPPHPPKQRLARANKTVQTTQATPRPPTPSGQGLDLIA